MFSVTVTGLEGFEDAVLDLRALAAYREISLAPLEASIHEVLQRGRARVTSLGLDRLGQPLVEITEETEQRRARAGKGNGPPLAPDGLRSHPFFDYTLDVTFPGPGRVRVLVDWPNAPWLQKHAQGIPTKRGRIVRDVLGIDPQTLAELERLVADYITSEAPKAGFFTKLQRGASQILGRLFGP